MYASTVTPILKVNPHGPMKAACAKLPIRLARNHALSIHHRHQELPMTPQRLLIVVVLACFATVAHAAAPAAGWRRVVDLKNHCRMDVPANWSNRLASMQWFPQSPDHSASAAITTSRVTSMALAHQQVMGMRQQGVSIVEDGARMLWYASKNGDDTSWSVLVPGTDVICHVDIEFKHASDASIAKQIALSVAPLP